MLAPLTRRRRRWLAELAPVLEPEPRRPALRRVPPVATPASVAAAASSPARMVASKICTGATPRPPRGACAWRTTRLAVSSTMWYTAALRAKRPRVRRIAKRLSCLAALWCRATQQRGRTSGAAGRTQAQWSSLAAAAAPTAASGGPAEGGRDMLLLSTYRGERDDCALSDDAPARLLFLPSLCPAAADAVRSGSTAHCTHIQGHRADTGDVQALLSGSLDGSTPILSL